MKTKIIFGVALFFVTLIAEAYSTPEQGIQFFKGTWQEAQELASKEGKKIFVDFYTTWCGPCKKMKNEVFPDSAVGGFYNTEFVCIQIDAEHEENELVQEMKLDAYPTLAIFEPDGKLQLKNVGYMSPEELLGFAKASLNKEALRPITDPNDITGFKKYIETLQYMGKASPDSITRLVNCFLNHTNGENLKSKDAWDLIVNHLEDFSGDAFDYLSSHADFFYQEYPDFGETYTWFIDASIKEASGATDVELLKEAKEHYLKMRTSLNNKTRPDVYYTKAIDLSYLSFREDKTDYIKCLIRYINTYHSKDWQYLAGAAIELLGMEDSNHYAMGIELSKKAYALNKNYCTLYLMAYYEDELGNGKAARKLLKKAIGKTTDQDLFLDGSLGVILVNQTRIAREIPLRIED